MTKPRSWTRTAALAFLLSTVLAGGGAFAQGILQGVVTTPEGTPLPGVCCLWLNQKDLEERIGPQTTRSGGYYRFSNIKPGMYDLEVDVPGFAPLKIPIRVFAAEPTKNDVELQLKIKEEVIVIGKRKPIEESPKAITRFSPEMVENLPVVGDQFQDLVEQAPGVAITDQGEIVIRGARYYETQVMVGGTSMTDPFGLFGANQIDISTEAIEEMQIVTGGFDATMFGFQGGQVKLITKEGKNEWESSIGISVLSGALDRNGALGWFRPSTFTHSKAEPKLTLGGPLIRDKWWFFTNVIYYKWDYSEYGLSRISGVKTFDGLDGGWRTILLNTSYQLNEKNRLKLEYLGQRLKYNTYGNYDARQYGVFIPTESDVVEKDQRHRIELWAQSVLGQDLRLETTLASTIHHLGDAPYKPVHERKIIPCSALKTVAEPTHSVTCVDDFVMGPWPNQFTFTNKSLQWEERFTQFSDKRWGGDHKFTYGFRVEHHDNRFDERWEPIFFYTQRSLEQEAPGQTSQDVEVAVPYIQPRRDTMRLLGLYAQDEMRVSQRWSFNFGGNYLDQRLTTFGYRGNPDGYVDFWGHFQGRRPMEPTPGIDVSELGNNTGCLDREFLLSSDSDEFWNPDKPNDPIYMRCMPINRLNMSTIGVTDITKYIPGVINYVADAEALRFGDGNFTAFFSAIWRPYGDENTVVRFNLSRQYGQLARYMGWETTTQEVAGYLNQNTDPQEVCNYFTPDGTHDWDNTFHLYDCYQLPEYYLFDRELDTPYTDEWTVSVARNITDTFGIDVRYTNRRAYKQPFLEDINQTFDEEGTLRPIDPTDLGASGGKNKNFRAIWDLSNRETRTFESVEVILTKYMSRNWELSANYSYIISTGVAEDIAEFEEGLEYAPWGLTFLPEPGFLEDDQRHEVNISLLNYFPGEFRVGTIVNWASGRPYSQIYVYSGKTVCPYPLCGGYLGQGRNAFRNPSHWRLDLSLIKDFEWGESWGTLGLEVSNLFNEAFIDDQSAVLQHFRRESEGRMGPLNRKAIFFAEHDFGRSWEFSFTYHF
jgi:hypothetical protein